eukprot:46459-Rhodomonas_salina.1
MGLVVIIIIIIIISITVFLASSSSLPPSFPPPPALLPSLLSIQPCLALNRLCDLWCCVAGGAAEQAGKEKDQIARKRGRTREGERVGGDGA